VLEHVRKLPAEVLASKVVTSAHAHMDLYELNLYKQVLCGVDAVQLVGCHDLTDVLQINFGVRMAKWYPTPPEFKFKQMFGETRVPSNESKYLDRFSRISDELRITESPVFLIAAGLMGKLLCHRVRELGGVAIDIGCVADYWSGQPTRIQPPRADIRRGFLDRGAI
jgi:hypothetical protein